MEGKNRKGKHHRNEKDSEDFREGADQTGAVLGDGDGDGDDGDAGKRRCHWLVETH